MRGISSSISYAGKEDSGGIGEGIAAAPFHTEVVADGGAGLDGTTPSGISPTLSITKGCGDLVLNVFLRLGRREFSAEYNDTCVSSLSYGQKTCLPDGGSGGRSSKRTTGIESMSSCNLEDARLSVR